MKSKLKTNILAEWKTLKDFIEHWQGKYQYRNGIENLYLNNIRKPLTKKSRDELFQWKNGVKLSKDKRNSVENNYPLSFTGSIEDRYFDENQDGGAIWNIFYAHILQPDKYPIFDQHTYRAMIYLQNLIPLNFDDFEELEKKSKREIYRIYQKDYIPFYSGIQYINPADQHNRHKDQALFAFGKFLKTALKYL